MEPIIGSLSRPSVALLGRTAPGFTLPTAEGQYVSLSDFRDSKVVLLFLRHFS